MSFTKKEQLNGSQKVVVGNKYNDLVLRTLGRVYIQTGSKFTLLTEYLDKVTNNKVSGGNVIIWKNEDEMNDSKYPGDGYFIYVSSSKNLFISLDGIYVPLVANNMSNEDWENLKKLFISKYGDTVENYLKVNGMVTADEGIFNDYIEINGTKAPLKVQSKELVKNLNAEYIHGWGSHDISIKSRNENISGQWNFNSMTTFNGLTRVSDKLISREGFAPGFTGYGWMLDTNTCTLTIDNLIVRKLMQVYELVVNKISATNGSLWVSDSAKIKSVEYVSGGKSPYEDDEEVVPSKFIGEEIELKNDLKPNKDYFVTDVSFPSLKGDKNEMINIYNTYFKDGRFYYVVLDEDYCPFRLNDLLRCQRFDGQNINYYDAIVTRIVDNNSLIIQISPSINDIYYLPSYDENGNFVELKGEVQHKYERDEDGNIKYYPDSLDPEDDSVSPKEEFANTFERELGVPNEGDGLVRIGNTVVKNRKGAIYITSNDVSSPHIDVLDDVIIPDFNKSVTFKNDDGKIINKRPLKVRLGNLNGIYDTDFIQQPNGYGLYADNVFLKGKFMQVNSSGAAIPIPVYRGKYDPDKTYYKDDQVTFEGQIYIALVDKPTNDPNDTNQWEIFIEKGQPGETGVGAAALFYGKYDYDKPYPLSKEVTIVVYLESETEGNKQYFRTKLIDSYNGEDSFSQIPPLDSNGNLNEPWENFGADFQSIATELLAAENANVAGFIFKNNQLTSQYGTWTELTDNFVTIDNNKTNYYSSINQLRDVDKYTNEVVVSTFYYYDRVIVFTETELIEISKLDTAEPVINKTRLSLYNDCKLVGAFEYLGGYLLKQVNKNGLYQYSVYGKDQDITLTDVILGRDVVSLSFDYFNYMYIICRDGYIVKYKSGDDYSTHQLSLPEDITSIDWGHCLLTNNQNYLPAVAFMSRNRFFIVRFNTIFATTMEYTNFSNNDLIVRDTIRGFYKNLTSFVGLINFSYRNTDGQYTLASYRIENVGSDTVEDYLAPMSSNYTEKQAVDMRYYYSYNNITKTSNIEEYCVADDSTLITLPNNTITNNIELFKTYPNVIYSKEQRVELVNKEGLIPGGSNVSNINYGLKIDGVNGRIDANRVKLKGDIEAESGSIGGWRISGENLQSINTIPWETTPVANLNSKTGEISVTSGKNNNACDEYGISAGSVVKINPSSGSIEARNYKTFNNPNLKGIDAISRISSSGVFANFANTLAVDYDLSGIIRKAAIIGYGQGVVKNDLWRNDNVLAGVYGRATNYSNDPCPAFGGYFENLCAEGLVYKLRGIFDDSGANDKTLKSSNTMVMGFVSNTVEVTLPTDVVEGQVIYIKQCGSGTLRVLPAGGYYIYDDSSRNDYYSFSDGQGGVFVFSTVGINGVICPVWWVNRYKF